MPKGANLKQILEEEKVSIQFSELQERFCSNVSVRRSPRVCEISDWKKISDP